MNTRNLLEIVINEYLDVFIRRDVLKYSHMGNVYVSKDGFITIGKYENRREYMP